MVLELFPVISTIFFLLVISSYYILMLIPRRRQVNTLVPKSISVVIPAHNEEEYIAECIHSVQGADFLGKKQIIVVDDGSKDLTFNIARKIKGITVIQTKHSGKSDSINRAIEKATGDLIAIVDADSIIHKDALIEVCKAFQDKRVGGACGVVKVKNKYQFLNIWVHLELIYNSLIRSIHARVNGNITTPGPLSVYRRSVVIKAGGFSTDGFSEDQDIAIRLIRAGHKIDFVDTAISETNMPYKPKEFLRQRMRYARGGINIYKKHLRMSHHVVDFYTLPLFFFSFLQSVIMSTLTLYNVSTGYYMYFFAKGMYFNWHVLKFFLDWFSFVGVAQWMVGFITGVTPITPFNLVGLVAGLLSYPLFIYSILKYDKKIRWYHIVSFTFMGPFWFITGLITVLSLPEIFRKKQYNIWKKNE